MKNKHTAKGILIIIVFVLGILVGRWTDPHDLIQLEGDTRWCFYGEYGSVTEYDAVRRAQNSFISFKGSKVWVFTHCEAIYEATK